VSLVECKHYLKLDKYMTKEFGSKELFPEERLTCNLNALMSSQEVLRALLDDEVAISYASQPELQNLS
jgi:hypothetical protein